MQAWCTPGIFEIVRTPDDDMCTRFGFGAAPHPSRPQNSLILGSCDQPSILASFVTQANALFHHLTSQFLKLHFMALHGWMHVTAGFASLFIPIVGHCSIRNAPPSKPKISRNTSWLCLLSTFTPPGMSLSAMGQIQLGLLSVFAVGLPTGLGRTNHVVAAMLNRKDANQNQMTPEIVVLKSTSTMGYPVPEYSVFQVGFGSTSHQIDHFNARLL
ncbi:hypothetical protein D9757_013091 [Collybiopsis confluens]|uniref:Uncharacterized protein n=1 Tax=Collybiopsis confluens TaxID=2823264 RepID=A0A8H5GHW2_9AGAR|nr:hypothetical protein D9757_013091 [Collybiopsis confluens]